MAIVLDKLATVLIGKFFQQLAKSGWANHLIPKNEGTQKIEDALNLFTKVFNSIQKKPFAVEVRCNRDTQAFLQPVISSMTNILSTVDSTMSVIAKALGNASSIDTNQLSHAAVTHLMPVLARLDKALDSTAEVTASTVSTLNEAAALLKAMKVFVRCLTTVCFSICILFVWCKRDSLLNNISDKVKVAVKILFVMSLAVLLVSPLWIFGVRIDMLIQRFTGDMISAIIVYITK